MEPDKKVGLSRVCLTRILLASILMVIGCSGASGELGLCYQGISLGSGFRAFADDSPWNSSLSASPALEEESAAMITRLASTAGTLRSSIVNWTIPLFVVSVTNCAGVSVSSSNLNATIDPDGDGVVTGLPIPDEAWPDPEQDGHMMLVDPDARTAWDFSKVVHKADGSWSASRVDIWDLNGSGYRTPFDGSGWWLYGARGSGMPLIGGLIRPEEIADGDIRHALVIAGPTNRSGLSDEKNLEVCTPTASRTDGKATGSDSIRMGARLQLDPAVDLDSLPLTPEVKIIARAMQVYGMYMGDSGPTIKVYLQNVGSDGGVWNNYDFSSLADIPVDRFRVIKCETVATKRIP